MQLRELIKSQKVLTPMISAQVNNPNSEWDAFSQILAKKSEAPAGIAKKELASREPSQLLKPKSEIDTERVRPEIKVSDRTVSSPVSNEDQVSSQNKISDKNEVSSKNRVVDREDRPKDEKETEKVTETETEATKKLKEALKNKLKKNVKLDDGEIEAMLQSLNLSLPALEQLVNGGEEALTVIANLMETLDSLEIDAALEQTLSSGELKQIEGQISQLMKTLTKLSEATEPATSQTTESPNETGGKAHEQQVIQQLSKLLVELNQGEAVKPEALRKSILEAIEGKTAEPSVPSSELEKGVADMPSEAKVPDVAQSKGIAKALEQMGKSEPVPTEPKVDLPKQVETPNVIVARNGESSAVKQATSGETAESVEPEVKTVDNKFMSAHQLLMKQGNTLTTPANQPVQQLKQEVFSQILEAMKGQIKLTDQGASMLVKLQPEQLGNVELKLNIQKGIVLAEIKVENEIVKAAIESNLDDLRQSLNNKGYSVDQINVNIDSGKKDQQEAFSFLNQEHNGKKGSNGHSAEKTVQTEQVETLSRYIIDELEGTTFNYYG